MNEDKILQAIDALSKQMGERFTSVEERLDKIESKLDDLETGIIKEIRDVSEYIYERAATKEDLEIGLETLNNKILKQELEVGKLKRIK